MTPIASRSLRPSTAPALGHNVVFAVILGSGAGAGVAVAGKAHHGPNNSAGEWGHNPLPRPDVTEIPGPSCYCGRNGCLERWVSGWSFARDYHQHASIDLAHLDRSVRPRSWTE